MRRLACTAMLLAIVACVGQLDPPPPRLAEEFTQGRALVDLDALARTREQADAAPEDLALQWSAGMAHVRASLQIALYESLIEPEQRERGTTTMDAEQFHFASFVAAAEALQRYDQGRSLAALRQLVALDDQPDTAPRRQIVALAEHRLEHLGAYAGARELLPPWPSGVTGCVACHSREATLPTDDLYLLPSL